MIEKATSVCMSHINSQEADVGGIVHNELDPRDPEILRIHPWHCWVCCDNLPKRHKHLQKDLQVADQAVLVILQVVSAPDSVQNWPTVPMG